MAITANGTALVYNDGTIQTTASGTGRFETVLYTSPGIFTKSNYSNLKHIKITLKGAGGGGGGAGPNGGPVCYGGHGGSGATMTVWLDGPIVPANIYIATGVPGAGGPVNPAAPITSTAAGTASINLITPAPINPNHPGNIYLEAGGGYGGGYGQPIPAGGGATGAPGVCSWPLLAYPSDLVSYNQPTHTLFIAQPGYASMGYGEYGAYGPSSGGSGGPAQGLSSGGGGAYCNNSISFEGGSGNGGFVFVEIFY